MHIACASGWSMTRISTPERWLSPAPLRFPSGLPPREVATEHATEPRPQVRSDIEVFHQRQAARLAAPLLHFAIDRLVGAVRQHGVDDGGENHVNEHLHGELPEHGSPSSAYV